MSGRLIIIVGEKVDGSLASLYAGRDGSEAETAIERARTGRVRYARALFIRQPKVHKRVNFDPPPVPEAVPPQEG